MKNFITAAIFATTVAAAPAHAQQSQFERLFTTPYLSFAPRSLLWDALDYNLKVENKRETYHPFTLRDSLISARLQTLSPAHEAALLQEPLYAGEKAPDFTLPDQDGRQHRLSDLRGKTVVLSFYPQDFTFMCSGVAVDFDRAQPAFDMRSAVVFSVSVQPVSSKSRFAQTFGISHHALLADSERTVARAYRVLNSDGLAARVTFIIGPNGAILSTTQNTNRQTYVTDVLSTLDQLETRSQKAPFFASYWR